MPKKKPKNKKYPSDDKWPAQQRVVPIGLGERGWQGYEPFKKGSDKEKGISVSDALEYYRDNPGEDGRPVYLDSSSHIVEFENKKRYSFDEIVTKYRDEIVTKQSEKGFYDGPTDLGKRPKGDFPSVTWMPKGNEDLDVDPNKTTASKGNDGQVDESKAEWRVLLFDGRGVQYFANEADAKSYYTKAETQDKDPSTPTRVQKEADLDTSDETFINQLIYDYLEKIPENRWYEFFNETEMERLREEYREHNVRLREDSVESHFENLQAADWLDMYEKEMADIIKEEIEVAESVGELEERNPGLGQMYMDRIKTQAKQAEESKKKEEPPKLTNKMMTDMVPMLIEEGEPTNHTCGNCNMRYTDKEGVQRCTVVEGKISYANGTCNYQASGEEASEEDSVDMKMSYDTSGYVESDKKIQCATCKYYDAPKEYCKLWMGKIKPEGCCMAWDRDDVTVPTTDKKSALEHPLTQEEQDEVAAKWGPEYNSAALHYNQAIVNGHSHDRALDYAVEEMHKQDIHISKLKFMEVKNTYLKGKVQERK